MIAQGAHAAMLFMLDESLITGLTIVGGRQCLISPIGEEAAEWIENAFTKVCVRVDSEEELFDIKKKAEAAKLTVHMVRDSGKTEFGGQQTYTCLAVGPNEASEIDKITGHLRLL